MSLNDDFLTMEYSGSGDVTGDLVPTNDVVIPPGAEASTSNSGCEPGDFTPASATEDQVALIQRGTCDFVVKAENAEAAGYDAVVIFNEGQEGRQETLNGTLGGVGVSIPVIGTSFAVGEELYALTQAGEVVVRVATSTITETRHTANLLADTKTGRNDRTVVVGAHLDSVPEGPGINDNGSGSAADLEVALQMAELGIEPRNKVRFAWWGAEESGLIGSQFYVDSLTKRQIKNIAVNLNFDMVGSPNYVRFVYDGDASDTDSLGSTGSGVVEDVFVDYFDSQGLASEPTAFDGRSDYEAFINVGIPAGGLFTGAEEHQDRRRKPPSTVVPPDSRMTRATTRHATTSTTCPSRPWTRCQTRSPMPRLPSLRPSRQSRARTRATPRGTRASSRAQACGAENRSQADGRAPGFRARVRSGAAWHP